MVRSVEETYRKIIFLQWVMLSSAAAIWLLFHIKTAWPFSHAGKSLLNDQAAGEETKSPEQE